MKVAKFTNGFLYRTKDVNTDEELQAALQEGFIQISDEDYELYATLNYIYDGEKPKKIDVYIPTLDELKAAKIAELKAERDAKEVEPIEYNENSFDYDDKARDRINAAIIALDLQGAEATLEWTTADNTNVTVTATDLKMVIAAVAVRSNALHIAYRAAKAEVQAAQTKEELEAIVLE